MECDNCSTCVTSTCDSGYYGSSCNLTCSGQCRVFPCASCACAACNVTSGRCLNGCKSGWFGDMCEEKCPENCSISQSFSTKCDQKSGICLYGCAEGSFGSTCNETCGSECEHLLCNQTTGECINGCIRGFKGYMCQERSGEPEEDQLAGAVGGAFVIVLWGAIVIILICVIRRRRQKEYEAFTRNRSLNSGRGSSRRRLHRQASVSSAGPQQQQDDVEQCTYEIVLPDFELQRALFDARRPQFMRSYSDESPMVHMCTHQTEMELRASYARNKCHSLHTSRDYEHPDDDVRSGDVIEKRASSDEEEEDPNELTEMWKLRKF